MQGFEQTCRLCRLIFVWSRRPHLRHAVKALRDAPKPCLLTFVCVGSYMHVRYTHMVSEWDMFPSSVPIGSRIVIRAEISRLKRVVICVRLLPCTLWLAIQGRETLRSVQSVYHRI